MTFITIVAIMGVLGSAIYNDDLFIMLLIPYLFYVMIKQEDFKDRVWLLEEKNRGVNKIFNNITDNLSNNSPILSNSLTNAEIKKALEDILHRINGATRIIIPQKSIEELYNILQNALDLINRQNFRIIQLEKQILEIQNANLIDFKSTIGNYMAENESLKAQIEELQDIIFKYNGNLAKQVAENESLKAEIERLKNSFAISQKETKRYMQGYKQAKAEAYKEAFEKVKEKSCKLNMCHNDVVVKTDYQISGEELNNLLNELVKDNVQSLKQDESPVTLEQFEAAYEDKEKK